MAVAKLKSSPLYSALDSTCQQTKDQVQYWIAIKLMGMGRYGYSEERLALIPPARGDERSRHGPPELSAAVHLCPLSEDLAPMAVRK